MTAPPDGPVERHPLRGEWRQAHPYRWGGHVSPQFLIVFLVVFFLFLVVVHAARANRRLHHTEARRELGLRWNGLAAARSSAGHRRGSRQCAIRSATDADVVIIFFVFFFVVGYVCVPDPLHNTEACLELGLRRGRLAAA